MIGIVLIFIVLVLLAIATYFWYQHWVKPPRIMRWYVSTLEALGYKVLVLPYQPFRIPLSEIRKFNQGQHKDAFFEEKTEWPKYDIVVTNTGNIITLILIKPRLMNSLFSREKQQMISKSISNKIGSSLVLGNSLVLNDYVHWKRKRKIFTDILNFEFIKSKMDKMVGSCSRVIDKMERNKNMVEADDQHRIYSVELVSYFEEMLTDVIIKLFFGTEEIDISIDGVPINQYITRLLIEARDQSGDWMVLLFKEKAYEWSLAPKYRHLYQKIAKLRGEVKKLLERKVQQYQNVKLQTYQNLFEALLYLKQQRNQEHDLLDTDQLISQFCAFVSASNDSTANYLNGLFYYLSKNQVVLKTLQKNVREVINKEEDITYSKIRALDYLEWCLNENLRIYGPGTSVMLREANTDFYVDNVPIMKGTGLKIEQLANHYNPIFYKDPFKFDPSRWNNHDIDPYLLGGFGYGAHACLGKSLAILLTKITTVLMLIRFDKIQISSENEISLVFRGTYKPTKHNTLLSKVRKQRNNTRVQIEKKWQEINSEA